ncbi:MAG: dihydroorotate dehydrogenase electron transfer subunit, partial [Spirochaetota bacterium]|nr:dihydroorotate dehydrogenase electron transfer subunit [Spirochaetota bacterium]
YIKELIIHENKLIKNRFYRLVMESEEIALKAQPGQFLHIQVQKSLYPLLRRPFSIYRINGKYIEILYERVGEGTSILSQRHVGEILNCHGPLGNSYSCDINDKTPLLVGGGIGIAPLLFLGERFLNKSVDVILGYRSLQDVIGEEDFINIGLKPTVTTNDGTYGIKGFVTDVLKNKLKENHVVFACGPIPMLKAVANICNSKGNKCEISIHNFMGCGFGVCLGCVFPTKDGLKRVCKDGPIFDSKDLIFS